MGKNLIERKTILNYFISFIVVSVEIGMFGFFDSKYILEKFIRKFKGVII